MTGGPGAGAVAIQAGLAVALLLIGTWGRQAAGSLPPTHLSADERAQRARVLGRGSVACLVVGAILAISVLWALAL